MADPTMVPNPLPPEVREVDVLVLAGQSNMSGRGRPIPDYVNHIDRRIVQFGSLDRRLKPAAPILDMHDAPKGYSPGLIAAMELLPHEPPNRGIVLIPAAHGGMGFRTSSYPEPPRGYTAAADTGGCWEVGHGDPRNLYDAMISQVREARTALEGCGLSVTWRAMLWHQGESDVNALSLAQYQQSLLRVLAGLRDEVGAPELPMVVGGLSSDWADVTAGAEVIQTALRTLPRLDSSVAYVAAQAGTGRQPDDQIHLGPEGVTMMGTAMAGALRGLELVRS